LERLIKMSETFKELPGWTFEIDEVSANVYQVKGHDEVGRAVERTGTDIDTILEECKKYAREQLNPD
jgi:hypothetical protein